MKATWLALTAGWLSSLVSRMSGSVRPKAGADSTNARETIIEVRMRQPPHRAVILRRGAMLLGWGAVAKEGAERRCDGLAGITRAGLLDWVSFMSCGEIAAMSKSSSTR